VKRLALLLLPLALASCQKPLREAHPALWAVQDADTTIYLFGTVHMLDGGTRWFEGGLKQRFEASGELRLELVQEPGSDKQTLAQTLGAVQHDTPLSERLPPTVAQKFRAALVALGQPADAFAHDDIWFAAIMLSQLSAGQAGYSGAMGVEPALTEDAASRHMAMTGFETRREQGGYLASLSSAAQVALLEQTIDNIPKAKALFGATGDAWAAGDDKALAKLLDADLKRSPELRETMLAARNRRWADWVAKRMDQPGTVFVAVGAGHLAGSDSVQHLLVRKGLKVTRVAY
jgi:uncharacterized protein YbaP (TraB family)